MLERRQTTRTRVIYRGQIDYHERRSRIDCVIRNFSEDGVRIEFDNPTLLPDEFDLIIARKHRRFQARLAWRNGNRAGLTFRPASPHHPVALDLAQRLRLCASEQQQLQRRIAQLLSNG